MPSHQELLFDFPIYTEIGSEEGVKLILEIVAAQQSKLLIAGYNPKQDKESDFIVNDVFIPGYELKYRENDYVANHFIQTIGGFFFVNIKCKRTDMLFPYFFHFDPVDKVLKKIGQYPSVADYHISHVKKYSRVLSKEMIREFTKAIGLAANGVGVGSFVYLRRIYEHLIFEAFTDHETHLSVSREDFNVLRIGEKIDVVADHLPDFLVSNKSIYGILSLGIHELTEQQCLEYFDPLRLGIEAILDEKVETKNRLKKREDAVKAINAVRDKTKS